MAFPDDTLESTQALSDGRVIVTRDCTRIEEAAAIVELDVPQHRVPRCHRVKRPIDLLGDGSGRNGFGERVLPQIAHYATPRTFAVGQKHRRYGNYFAGVASLLLNETRHRPARVERLTLRPSGKNPLVAVTRRVGVRVGHGDGLHEGHGA